VLPEWVQIYCSSPTFREWITGQITGTTGSHARAKPANIFDQEIPLPPLAEQKRIVAMLDEAFAGIDEAKAKTEASELAAKELKVSILKQLIEPKESDTKAEWKTVKLGDLTDLITKGTTPTSVGHEFYASGINFIKVESISPNGNFIRDRFAHISTACHEALKRSQLQTGDILFSIAGALGRTGLVTEEILPANTNQALSVIRLKSDAGVNASYLLKALESSLVLEQVEKVSGGAAQQNLSLAQVRDFEIPIPPLAEQKRIVALLDEAFAEISELNNNDTTKLNGFSELKSSLLAQAFAGELTA
jgi:type I restriction enzyme S subunit